MSIEVDANNADTVPALPELWRAQALDGRTFEAITRSAAVSALLEYTAGELRLTGYVALRCRDCGHWCAASTEKRTRAAIELHRVSTECRTLWELRQLLWDGYVPTAAQVKLNAEQRDRLQAIDGPGSFQRGAPRRRARVTSRTWVMATHEFKLTADGAAAITRALALEPWPSAEGVRRAVVIAVREFKEPRSIAFVRALQTSLAAQIGAPLTELDKVGLLAGLNPHTAARPLFNLSTHGGIVARERYNTALALGERNRAEYTRVCVAEQ